MTDTGTMHKNLIPRDIDPWMFSQSYAHKKLSERNKDKLQVESENMVNLIHSLDKEINLYDSIDPEDFNKFYMLQADKQNTISCYKRNFSFITFSLPFFALASFRFYSHRIPFYQTAINDVLLYSLAGIGLVFLKTMGQSKPKIDNESIFNAYNLLQSIGTSAIRDSNMTRL